MDQCQERSAALVLRETVPSAIMPSMPDDEGHRRPLMLRLFAALLLTLFRGRAGFSRWRPRRSPADAPSATLITDSDSVVPGGPGGGHVRIALRLRLADGWHTYWRNPGEAGVPVETGRKFSCRPKVLQLRPDRVAHPGPDLRRIHHDLRLYRRGIILPVTRDSGPWALARFPGGGGARAHWLACKDICVPEEATFQIDLPAGAGARVGADGAVSDTRSGGAAAVPVDRDDLGGRKTVRARRGDWARTSVVDAWFIPDAPGQIVDDAAQLL